MMQVDGAGPARASNWSLSGASQALVTLGSMLRGVGYRFVTPTPSTHACVNRRPENEWARSLTDVFGWSRPFRAGTLPASVVEQMRAAGVVAIAGDGLRSTVRLSSIDDLLFFHSAHPTGASDAVFFGPDTYRFARAIEQHLAMAGPVGRVADIGCGAGPGGLIVAASRPDAEVLMLDINAEALRLAEVNAVLNGATRAVATTSDILTATTGSFDLIVSNPPYLIDPSQRSYRHGGGTFGEGLSLRILEAALPRLAPGGTVLLYTGSAIVDGVDGFGRAAESVLASSGRSASYVELDPDVFGEELATGVYAAADRIAAVLLTVR